MALTLGFVIVPGNQSSAAPITVLKVEPTNPYGGTNIDPLPASATILTVTNGKKSVNYSMNDLSTIKSTVIAIYEPFLKKRQKFTVIPLDYFFARSSIKPSMTVDTMALNDYKFSEEARNFSKARAYVAIKRFGKNIPYDQGGPIRIIYANSSTWVKNLSAWNWSIRTIKAHPTD